MAEQKLRITVLEAAKMCGVSRWTMLRWVRDRVIPSIRYPGAHGIRLDVRDVERFIRRHRVDPKWKEWG